jgi:HK97 family phage major capsid protein
MATKLSPTTLELRDAISEAETLTAQPSLSKRDETRVNVLLAKIKTLREGVKVEAARDAFGCTDLELRWFKALHSGTNEYESQIAALRVLNPSHSEADLRQLNEARLKVETRANLAEGTQTITYTQALLGGTLVPTEFQEDIFLGLAQVDPLLDDSYVTQIKTKGTRPLAISGWDLSTFSAQRITEGTQLIPQTVPTAATQQVGGWPYRAELAASFEIEEDAYEVMLKLMKTAFAIGFARGIGKDLVNGNGTQQPGGLVAGVASSGVTLNHTMSGDVSVTLNDGFQQAYFSVNRIYRASKSCCWVMNDDTYQWVRSLTDSNKRPLLDISKDKETLMGKPVIIAPSMPGKFFQASPITAGKIIFGDMSRFIVRTSQITVTRHMQASGFVDKGMALYVGHMRADSQVHDPTGGGSPALVSIAVN